MSYTGKYLDILFALNSLSEKFLSSSDKSQWVLRIS